MTDTTGADGGRKLQPKSIERGRKVLSLMQGMRLSEKKVNFLKGLPPMIMQNGLGQTIAYLQVKENKESQEDYKGIVDIFKKMFGDDKLMNTILEMDAKKYTATQKEAIEYAGWIKKFAQALYEKETLKKEAGDADTAAE